MRLWRISDPFLNVRCAGYAFGLWADYRQSVRQTRFFRFAGDSTVMLGAVSPNQVYAVSAGSSFAEQDHDPATIKIFPHGAGPWLPYLSLLALPRDRWHRKRESELRIDEKQNHCEPTDLPDPQKNTDIA